MRSDLSGSPKERNSQETPLYEKQRSETAGTHQVLGVKRRWKGLWTKKKWEDVEGSGHGKRDEMPCAGTCKTDLSSFKKGHGRRKRRQKSLQVKFCTGVRTPKHALQDSRAPPKGGVPPQVEAEGESTFHGCGPVRRVLH